MIVPWAIPATLLQAIVSSPIGTIRAVACVLSDNWSKYSVGNSQLTVGVKPITLNVVAGIVAL